jgi:hypothetical protein
VFGRLTVGWSGVFPWESGILAEEKCALGFIEEEEAARAKVLV